MTRATPADIELLVNLMADFYGEAGYQLDRVHAASAFGQILDDGRLGYIWIIQAEGEAVGHVVITTRFGMEYGGMIACLDDLYVRPPWRNRGLATSALQEVREFCRAEGIRAMTVEVGQFNDPARAAYERVGFAEAVDRRILALALAPPTHSSN